MPIENDGNGVQGEPSRQAPSQLPPRPPNQNPPTGAANGDSNQNESEVVKLGREVKAGERWLIGIGIATLIVNTAIALIYYGQLRTMSRTYGEIRDQTKAAQWSQYMACLNAQTAQNMFIQSQSSANDYHSQAVAAIQAAAAEMQSERASLLFLSRAPDPREMIGPNFGLMISLKNEGKGDAHDVAIKYWPVLLKRGETLRFAEQRKEQPDLVVPSFPAGYTFPEKAEPPHGQLALTAEVRDTRGSIVPTASKDVIDLMNGGSAMAFIFGEMTYSDIAGHHAERFCHAIWMMNGNTQRSGAPRRMSADAVGIFAAIHNIAISHSQNRRL